MMEVIPPIVIEHKQHPARFWRENKLGRHKTRKCDGCGGDLFVEAYPDGRLAKHFCCSEVGCTWPDYHAEALWRGDPSPIVGPDVSFGLLSDVISDGNGEEDGREP